MARKEIQTTLCDFHLEDGDEIDADPNAHVRLSVNGQDRELDLCPTCAEQLRVVLDHAMAVGTPPVVNGKRDTRNLGGARDFECPECHQWYSSRATLGQHVGSAHGLTGAEWAAVNPYATKRKASPVPEDPCEICGYRAATVAGMAAHKRFKHPAPAAKRRGRPAKAAAA